MPRQFTVSTDVYAAVWSARLPGEETEDAILRRILRVGDMSQTNSNDPPSSPPHSVLGLYDRRNDVQFPPGFQIFRTYKRRSYRAHVRAGEWYREDNEQSYPTLNQLSNSIGANEDAWEGWLYRDQETGETKKVDALRQRLNASALAASPEALGLI